MMNNYKLEISFYGRHFLGWQSQKDFSPTIQDTLNKALKEIFKSEEISTIACGRTDSGVSAKVLVVKLIAPFEIPSDSLLKAINSKLPVDIRVRNIEKSEDDFHPIFSAKQRTYKYLFTNHQGMNPFETLFMPNVKYDLNWDLMREACGLFLGEHDFRDFMCVGSEVESTTRTIYKIEISEPIQANLQGLINEYYTIEITGNGFLKQMVRLIVGCLWNIGRGKVTLEQLKMSLRAPGGTRLGAVAPASGLYKISTSY